MQTREPGQLVVGKYRLIRLLGQGGVGSVWHAQHLALNAPVALKFIEGERLNAAAQQRFLEEARKAAALSSPHVVKILDCGVEEGVPHLAMELLEGETLAARLERDQRLGLAETTRVVQHVARAIARAHDAGMIHRDLKPANVFIVKNEDDEQIKVADFGIGKGSVRALGDSVLAEMRTGARLGTPYFMSPEQFEGSALLDHRSDIWALGVLAYACLLGELPFAAEMLRGLALEISAQPLPVPSERGSVPQGFDAWFARACAREREARFGSAREAAAELAALSERASTLEASPPAGTDNAARGALGSETPASLGATVGRVPSSAATSQGLRPRRFLALGALALGLAALLVGRAQRSPSAGATAESGAGSAAELASATAPAAAEPAARRRSVAVISLRNMGGLDSDAWLGTAFADLLRTELESGDQLRTLSRERVATLKRDLQLSDSTSLERSVLARIQAILDADVTLTGSYLRLPESDGLRLDVTLQDARSGETLASLSEQGPAGELFALVARAGERLRAKLGAEALSPEQRSAWERTLPRDPQARVWYAEGRAQLDRGENLAARDLLAKVVEREPDYPLGPALLSQALGALFYDEQAAAAAERALTLADQLPRKEQLLVKARAYRRTGRADEAAKVYRSLFTVFPDDLDFGIELARAQVRASQSKDAEASIEALRKLPAPLGEDPRIDVVEAYLAVLLGDPPRAARSSRRAIDKAERLGMRTLAAEAFIMEGHGLFHQGRAAEARTALLEARSRFAFVHDRGGEGNALLELGQQESQQTTQGPELAREHLQQALEIFNLTGHLQGSALAHLGLGNAWGTTGRLKEAEAEFRLALQRFEAGAAQKGGIAAAHANLAIVQSTRGELAAAGESLSTALELVRKLGNRRLEGNALGTRAELGVLTGRLEQARADAAAATQIHQDLHDPGATAAFQVSSAQISRLLGEPAAARTLLEGALPALRAADQPDLLEMGLLTQLQLLLDAGQPERVLAERGAWTERFGLPYRLGSQASAHSRFALALLALGRLAEAREEAAAARRVVETSEEAAPRAESLFAQARVLSAAGEAQAARALLESASEIAQRAGRPSEYELELALAELEKARRAPAWRPTLENIARRAGAENFVFYANRARALLASD